MSLGRVTILFADYGGEKSSFSILTPEMTAGNFATVKANQQGVMNAVVNLSRGYWIKKTHTALVDGLYQSFNTDPLSVRENKWLVVYQDDVTGKQYRVEIPCARVDTGGNGRILPNSEMANFSSSFWVSFIEQFELAAVSPLGNAVSVVSAKVVGRNT